MKQSWPQNLRREPAGTPHTENIMAPSFVEGTRWEPHTVEASVAVAGVVVF